METGVPEYDDLMLEAQKRKAEALKRKEER